MPVHADGYLIPFDAGEISQMEIETLGVRSQTHPTEQRDAESTTMTREFLVNWDQRYNFLELVLGRAKLWNDAGVDKLSRLLPDPLYGRHPLYPSVVATKCEEMTGFGRCSGDDPDGMPVYPKAKVKILYELVPFTLLEDDDITSEFERYVIPPREAETDGEYTTLPGGILHYIRASGTDVPHLKPIPFNLGLVTPTQRRIWTWVRVPRAAFEAGSPLHNRVFSGEVGDPGGDYTRPYVGTINSAEFDGYPVGTLLFEGVNEKLKRDVLAGEWVYELAFRFNFRPQGWNWLPYFDTGSTPAANGVYFVGKDSTHYTADTLPDNYSLYDARDPNLLFLVS